MALETITYSIGPLSTPRCIKILILATVLVTIPSALLDSVVRSFWELSGFRFPGVESLLTLSWSGWDSGYYWQPFTQLFLYPSQGQGLNFGMLITLAFHMYILWVLGSELAERIGHSTFCWLYIIIGAAAAFCCLLLTPYSLYYYDYIGGATPAIIAVFTLWTMLAPERELLLFFLIPLKAKWLYAVVAAALLLVSLSQGQWADLALYSVSMLMAYSCGVLLLGLWAPYEALHFADKALLTLRKGALRLYHKVSRDKKTPDGTSSKKVIDITTGYPITEDDDQFVDAMLSKIARYGEESLSWNEKRRLDAIAQKKRDAAKKQ